MPTAQPPDFDSLLGAFQAFRTGYPKELYDRLLAAAPRQRDLRVLDVAHGTGLSAEGMRGHAAMLVGLDLAPGMLHASRWPDKVRGRAEALPFGAASFDLVTCAQSFHWMDAGPVWAEFHRVLRPEGVAAVWWKYQAADDPTARLADEVIAKELGGPAPVTPLARERTLPGAREGPFGGWEEVRLEYAHPFTPASYTGWQASREFLRRGAGPQRQRVLDAVHAALRAKHGTAQFEVRQLVRLCLLRKR